MIKLYFLIIINFLIFNLSFAKDFWSNEKEGPTNIAAAETYIFEKYLDITPSGERWVDVNPLHGIWYTQNLGFVAIYESSYKSNEFKMLLIKAPFGYGVNHAIDPIKEYKTHRDHEGTIEATLTPFNDLDSNQVQDYLSHNKFWYLQSDGSYKYKDKLGKIKFLSDNVFENIIETENKKDTFFKITPRIKEIFKEIDNSKLISEFEIETENGGFFIYFDTKIDDDFVRDKFLSLSPYNVAVGKIYRGIKNKQLNGIDHLICYNTGQLVYQKIDYDGVNDSSLPDPKIIKKDCDPTKISYSDYTHYINRQYYYGFGALLIFVTISLFLRFQRKKALNEFNKNNKIKFTSYSELREYEKKLEEKEFEKRAKKEEKDRKLEEAKLEKEAKAEEARIKAEERRLEREEKRKEMMNFKESENDYDDSLMDKVKRLKRLYKNGTLSKAEFEKAKNKLLK